ncbi:MAG: hypothetical protein WAX12_09100 [Candidatus Microthrix subdominans]|jgi:hypothetical protein
MASLNTLIEHLGEANPRMHLAEMTPEGSVPQINARLHPSGQVLPAPDETEIGRYRFSGGILSAASQSSGQLMRLLPAEESQDVQLIPFISGDGIVVVTDRRLLGQMNGESPLSDRIDDGGDGHLYFSMGYEDVDSISISQETSKVGALEERRVNVHGLQILGALGVEVTAAVTLSGDDVIESKLTTGRPFFDQVVRAAATYRMDLEPTLADRYQLNRVLDGAYEIEDDELVADLIVDRQ